MIFLFKEQKFGFQNFIWYQSRLLVINFGFEISLTIDFLRSACCCCGSVILNGFIGML